MRRGLTHIVELTRDEFAGARAVIACVELQSVRLSRFKFISHLEDRPKADGKMEVSTSSRFTPVKDGAVLTVNFDLGLQGHQGETLIIDLSAKIEAVYSVPEDQTFDPTQLKAFARSNGMLNVWPYWREYVQAATQRAGLASLTLPLFRVLQKPSEPKRKT